MRKIIVCTAVVVMALVGIVIAQDAKAPAPVMTSGTDLKWGDPPAVFEKGMSFTVVSGDPSKAGPYVVRLKMPAGYKIMPHWHPTDEHVTVVSGALAIGLGDNFDEGSMKAMPAGGYGLMPATVHHYAMAKADAIVQVHGMGPFALTYVNPKDDPTRRVAD